MLIKYMRVMGKKLKPSAEIFAYISLQPQGRARGSSMSVLIEDIVILKIAWFEAKSY